MLHGAIRSVDGGTMEPSLPATLVPVPAPSSFTIPSGTGDRYGRRSRPNFAAVTLIVLAHLAALAALVQARTHVVQAREEKLTVVNLAPPPPPPAADTPPPPPSAPQVVAPPPIVQAPATAVPMQTSPEPVPVLPVTMPAPPSPALVASVATPAPPSIIQGGDLGAQMVAGKPPRYPVESRRKREQGTVVLTLTLGLDGGVETLLVSQTSGFRRLDDAARDAVKGWRWKPFLRGGQPVKVRGEVEIPFVLRSEG